MSMSKRRKSSVRSSGTRSVHGLRDELITEGDGVDIAAQVNLQLARKARRTFDSLETAMVGKKEGEKAYSPSLKTAATAAFRPGRTKSASRSLQEAPAASPWDPGSALDKALEDKRRKTLQTLDQLKQIKARRQSARPGGGSLGSLAEARTPKKMMTARQLDAVAASIDYSSAIFPDGLGSAVAPTDWVQRFSTSGAARAAQDSGGGSGSGGDGGGGVGFGRYKFIEEERKESEDARRAMQAEMQKELRGARSRGVSSSVGLGRQRT